MKKNGWGIVSMLVGAALLAACGGGGGGSSAVSYTGVTTAAVITDSNADEIALAAFQGSDLGVSTGGFIAMERSGDAEAAAQRPVALAVVELLSGAANSALADRIATGGNLSGALITVDNTLFDGQGGTARYTLTVNDVTGAFSGTFDFTNFQGDGGGSIDGLVAVTGAVSEFSIRILFNFQSVVIADGTTGVTANGTVDLTAGTTPGSETGTAVLNLIFTDNITRKTLWLSNYTVATTVGIGYTDVTVSGRIYLHDYGYLDVVTDVPFRYPDLATFPSSGRMTVRGMNGRGVRLTADSQTQYTIGAELDGDGLYDDLILTLSW